ncbi:MAG: hypothetical protein ACK4JF_06505, partial [Methylohalobius sp.]
MRAWLCLACLCWSFSLLAQDGPDERILWQLFHAQKYRLLKQAIAEYQKQYPGWQPPAELLRLLVPPKSKASRLPIRLNAALRRGDSAQLLKLARQFPTAFSCLRPEALSALAKAYAQLGKELQAFAWYRKALSCPQTKAEDLLFEALWRLSPERFATLLEEAKPKLSPAAYAEI